MTTKTLWKKCGETVELCGLTTEGQLFGDVCKVKERAATSVVVEQQRELILIWPMCKMLETWPMGIGLVSSDHIEDAMHVCSKFEGQYSCVVSHKALSTCTALMEKNPVHGISSLVPQ